MAKRKPRAFSTEQVFGGASELAYVEKVPEKDLSEALFGVMDQQKTMDTFEEAAGIARKPEVKDKPYFKSITLDLDKEKDRKMLETLMNDDKYKIMSCEKNWSSLGRLRAFIIYSEAKPEDNKQQ